MAEFSIRAAEPEDTDSNELHSLLSASINGAQVTGLVTAARAHGVCLLAICGGDPLGCICVLPTDEPGAWVLRAIAVAADHRQSGVGRRLVQEAIARSEADVIHAETDNDAVDFYARLGFSVTSLGEKYPGVERFACTWRVSPVGDSPPHMNR